MKCKDLFTFILYPVGHAPVLITAEDLNMEYETSNFRCILFLKLLIAVSCIYFNHIIYTSIFRLLLLYIYITCSTVNLYYSIALYGIFMYCIGVYP